MRRKIMERLQKWQTAKNRLPLLLYGARQVGKTYILREFGRSCFENTVYVNFEEDKALAGYLEVKLPILLRLSKNSTVLKFFRRRR